jgi:hypothetical protein
MDTHERVQPCCRAVVFLIALTGPLSACDRAPERPIPPQSPPRPMATDHDQARHVRNAVLTREAAPYFHFQQGSDVSVRRLVIRT